MKRLSTIVLGVLLLTLFSPFLTSMPLGIEQAAAQTASCENLTASFTVSQNGATTTNSYSGLVNVTVSGVGQSQSTIWNDAFYMYTDDRGSAIDPRLLDSLVINGGNPARTFIPGGQTPTYRSDHTYSFQINAPGGRLTFGSGDLIVDDNNGSYTIKVCAAAQTQAENTGSCGPMDVAFIIDSTNDMNEIAFAEIKAGISSLTNKIAVASGGDYQLGLLTFNNNPLVGDYVKVLNDFSSGNADAVVSKVTGLNASNGGLPPEASDEALKTAINRLKSSDRGDLGELQQIGDFNGIWRSNATKIIVLVTSAEPGGFDEIYDDSKKATAHDLAVAAKNKGISIVSVFVQNIIEDNTGEKLAVPIMQDYANTTAGSFTKVSSEGSGTLSAIRDGIFNKCPAPTGFDVWMKDQLDDAGIEPNAHPNEPAYSSPDVKTCQSFDECATAENPVYGWSENYIFVTLRNNGPKTISPPKAAKGSLYVYWTAQGGSATWPTGWQLINVEKDIFIPSGVSEKKVRVQWPNVPAPGHYCLLARWVSDSDLMTISEGQNTYVNTVNNNNIVWRNVNVTDVLPQRSLKVKYVVRRSASRAATMVSPLDEQVSLGNNLEEGLEVVPASFPLQTTGEATDLVIKPKKTFPGTIIVTLGNLASSQTIEGDGIIARTDRTVTINPDGGRIKNLYPTAEGDVIQLEFTGNASATPDQAAIMVSQEILLPGSTTKQDIGGVEYNFTILDPNGPPVAPRPIIASTVTGIKLAWPHKIINASYEVWRSNQTGFKPGDAGSTLITTIASTTREETLVISYIDAGMQAGQDSPYYVVRSKNAAGKTADSRVLTLRRPVQVTTIGIIDSANPDRPWYANGQIEVSPYPVKQGVETTLSARVDNPTKTTQKVNLEFYVSGLGVGQWWTKVETLQGVEIPANGNITKSVKWFPATEGHYCVKVKVITAKGEFWLQRNLDIQKAEPGKCALRDFQVCNPYADTRTFTINATKQEGLAGCSASVAVKQVTLAPKACTTTQVSICVPQVACGSGKCAYRVEPDPGNDGVLFEVEVGGGICEVTPSATPTATDMPITPSLTPTATAKPITDTPTATNTPTNTPTGTAKPITDTPSATNTPTGTAKPITNTPTGTAKPITNTPTPTNTSTSGGTVTDDPTCKAEQIEVSGIGLKGLTTGSLSVPAASWVTLQMGGALAKTLPIPNAVSFGSERLTTVTAKDQWNYGYLFQTKQTNVAGPVTVKVEEVGTNQTARAAVAYFPKATSEKFVSAYNTTYEFVWGGTNGTWVIVQKAPLIVTLPKPLTKATNLTLKVAYMDNDNDARPLTVKAEAGGVTQEIPATASNIGELLNIQTVTLANVPAGTSEVKVTLLSRHKRSQSNAPFACKHS